MHVRSRSISHCEDGGVYCFWVVYKNKRVLVFLPNTNKHDGVAKGMGRRVILSKKVYILAWEGLGEAQLLTLG